jgi:hypothetical protein
VSNTVGVDRAEDAKTQTPLKENNAQQPLQESPCADEKVETNPPSETDGDDVVMLDTPELPQKEVSNKQCASGVLRSPYDGTVYLRTAHTVCHATECCNSAL